MTHLARDRRTPSPLSRALPRLRALPLAALLLAVWIPAAAYIKTTTSATDGAPIRWDLTESVLSLPNVAGGEVLYQVSSLGSDNVGDTSEMTAVEAAFRHWEGIPRAKVAFSRGPDTATIAANDDGVNVIYWAEGAKTTVLGSKNFQVTGFVGLTVIVNDTAGPTTGLLRNADIVLNGNEFTWTTDPAANPASYDVEEIITHEAGHVVGLDHSGVLGSSMYARVTPQQVLRSTLSSDDMAGAIAIYPDSDANTALGSQGGLVSNGLGGDVFGALVTSLDPGGSVIAQGVSLPTGIYSAQALTAGPNTSYAEALDKTTFGATTLVDERDIGGIYDATVITDFWSTSSSAVTITAGANTVRNYTVGSTTPATHISAVGQRSDTTPAAVIFSTRPTPLFRGDTNVYMGISGPGITSFVVFEVLGTGVTVNGVAATGSANGEPAVVYDVSVDANAPLGLRSIRVTRSGERTYATGSIEIMESSPMAGGVPGLPSAAPDVVAEGTSAADRVMTSVEPAGIRVAWPVKPDATEYNLYRGDLGTLRSSGYSHAPLPGPNGSCGLVGNSVLLAGDLTDGLSHYYLISARNRFGEGLLDADGDGVPRPVGSVICP